MRINIKKYFTITMERGFEGIRLYNLDWKWKITILIVMPLAMIIASIYCCIKKTMRHPNVPAKQVHIYWLVAPVLGCMYAIVLHLDFTTDLVGVVSLITCWMWTIFMFLGMFKTAYVFAYTTSVLCSFVLGSITSMIILPRTGLGTGIMRIIFSSGCTGASILFLRFNRLYLDFAASKK